MIQTINKVSEETRTEISETSSQETTSQRAESKTTQESTQREAKLAQMADLARTEKERVQKYLENIAHFRLHSQDTGSVQLQVVRLSARITELTGHFQSHKRDHHSRQGLLKMVSRRRKLLDYLKDTRVHDYQDLLQRINIRK